MGIEGFEPPQLMCKINALPIKLNSLFTDFVAEAYKGFSLISKLGLSGIEPLLSTLST
jgi:hypothetical protein